MFHQSPNRETDGRDRLTSAVAETVEKSIREAVLEVSHRLNGRLSDPVTGSDIITDGVFQGASKAIVQRISPLSREARVLYADHLWALMVGD